MLIFLCALLGLSAWLNLHLAFYVLPNERRCFRNAVTCVKELTSENMQLEQLNLDRKAFNEQLLDHILDAHHACPSYILYDN